MSENQIIGATIQVDTGNSNANVSALNKETSTLKQSLKETGATVKTTGKDVDLVGGSFGKLKQSMGSLPGPTKAASEGIGGLNQALNLLKANPIIAVIAIIVALVVALWEKFKKMEAVSDSLNKAFGALSGVIGAFVNTILTPLIDGFVKLVDVVMKAGGFLLSIFAPGLAEAGKRSGELADALDELEDAEKNSAIARAESNRKLQEAREIAGDANLPIKERIAALKEAGKIEKEELDKSIFIATQRAKIMLEQIGIELGVRKELLNAIRNGSLEQLKAARNEIMAMKNVDKEKLAAIDNLIIQAENEGAQRAKISKKTNTQIKGLEKEAAADAKATRDKAAQEAKAQQQKLNEFNTKLRQLQQENDLAQIKDGYQKELKALENKLDNDKKANEQAVKTGSLTRQQANLLNLELDKQANLKRQELTDKHNKEVAEKEAAFQTALNKLKQEIMLGGIVNSRQLEKEQLKISYEQSLQEAEKTYKEDAQKLAQIKALIDEKYLQDQRKQKERYDEEDRKAKLEKDKKNYEDSLKKPEEVLNQEIDPNKDFEDQLKLKQAAADAELVILRNAFEQKVLTEEDYNKKVDDLAGKRKKIAELETEHKKQQASEIGDTLTRLSDLVGKQTVAGKALGIATALINTYQGASEALKQKSTLPSPFDVIAKVVNVATVIATGIKTVKSIAAVQVPGQGGGSPSVSEPAPTAPPAPIAPLQSSTKLDQQSINSIGNVAQGGVNRTQRAYVIAGDIQSEAERNARLERAAKLGG